VHQSSASPRTQRTQKILSVDARHGTAGRAVRFVPLTELAAELLDLGLLLFDYRLEVSDELPVGAVVGAADGAVSVIASLAGCLQVSGIPEPFRVGRGGEDMVRGVGDACATWPADLAASAGLPDDGESKLLSRFRRVAAVGHARRFSGRRSRGRVARLYNSSS
jgi:hypothetical protein